MSWKILIIPDKFKGTLSASAVAQAIARGWRQTRPGDTLELLPATDGGDGFGEIIGGLIHARVQKVKTIDAAHRPCEARWWWEPKTKTAVIESANVIGLALLPPGKFHPFELDSCGLGTVIRAAARKGAKRCLVGIGGSATNDGGFGLARSLGWQFLDHNQNVIARWTDLRNLSHIRPPRRRRWFAELIVAVDVRNPLLGARGATRVYGPQKGLREEDYKPAENCLGRLAVIFKKQFRRDLAKMKGAGAAGGLGFGLLAFLNARAKPGFKLFSDFARLDQQLRSADLVVTGEGCLDASSLMGKGVGEIARRCRQLKIPCLALAGTVASRPETERRFTRVHALTDLTTIASAKAKPRYWLEQLAARAAAQAELAARRQAKA